MKRNALHHNVLRFSFSPLPQVFPAQHCILHPRGGWQVTGSSRGVPFLHRNTMRAALHAVWARGRAARCDTGHTVLCVCALILGALVGHRWAACLYCTRRPCYKKIGPRSCVVATPQGGDQCTFYAQTRDGQNTRAIPPITLRRWAPWPRVTSHFLLSRLAPCSHKVSILSKR